MEDIQFNEAIVEQRDEAYNQRKQQELENAKAQQMLEQQQKEEEAKLLA